MTGPDALIAIGVIACLAILLGLWTAARHALAQIADCDCEGADWGEETNHIGGR